MHTVAVLLAGGTGQRLGADVPKQLLEIAGRPVIEHTVAAFDSSPDVDEILVMMAARYVRQVEDLAAAGGYRKVSRVLEGGASRTHSTRRALGWLGGEVGAGSRPHTAGAPSAPSAPSAPGAAETAVLLHDAVRPLVTHRIIGECVRALATWEAATVAIPSADTVLEVEGDAIAGVPDRGALRRAQTPQGFRLPTIAAAHERAMADPDFTATDDAAVVLRYLPDVPIHVVPGSEDNIKVTHAGDVPVAETLLRRAPEAMHETVRGS